MIIDILLLFEFAHHRAAAMAAFDDAGEGEVALAFALRTRLAPIHHGLHAIPERARYAPRVAARIELPLPNDVARIKRVTENPVAHATRNGSAALAIHKTSFAR